MLSMMNCYMFEDVNIRRLDEDMIYFLVNELFFATYNR